MGSGGGGSQSTTTQVQQIPEFEQQYAQQNQDIAASIASQPYPTYQGQLIAGFSPQQQQGQQMAGQAATSYQPDVGTGEAMTIGAAGQWNPQTAAQYMSPYAQSALQPQIQAMQLQQAQQQHQIDAGATQAGAFGDARTGVATALNNFYGDQALGGIEAQGMNTAYNTGLGAYQADQSRLLQAGGQMGNLGGEQQTLGEAGANALQTSGAQQQQLTQQQLTEAYNNFMNQVNYPQNELNVRMSSLSNSPYNNINYTSLAPTNSSAANVGAFSSLAGLLGGGSSGGGVIGGTPISSSDIRLKKNLVRLGETPAGIPLYAFNYLWEDEDDNIHIGVLAQQIEEIIPEAVIINENGFRLVDYRRIR